MWNQLLDEAKSQRKFQNTPVIILGRKSSGKRSLVDSLIQISKTTIQSKRFSIDSNKMRLKGLAPIIDYTYLNVLDLSDTDYRTHSKLQIYMVEDARNPQMYSQLEKPELLRKAVVIIMLDFTNPWSFMEELDGWIRFLYQLQKKAGFSIVELQNMAKTVQHCFSQHKQPQFDENGKLRKEFDFEESQEIPELDIPEGVLTNNIRLPFIVCVNKCDLQSSVLRDESANKILYVMYHLRKFCLQYGGSLIYTSIKNNSNLSILYQYILYRAYNMPLRFKAELINQEAIFVPLGFDSPQLLQDSVLKVDVSRPYSEVVSYPSGKKNTKEEISVEEDSEYFKKYIGSSGTGKNEILTPQNSVVSEESTTSTKTVPATDFFKKLLQDSGKAQKDLSRHINKSTKMKKENEESRKEESKQQID